MVGQPAWRDGILRHDKNTEEYGMTKKEICWLLSS